MSDLQGRVQQALAPRYSIVREIGRGGMGVVYLADDLQLNRQVAIKVLRPELAQAVGAERFLREVRIEASLDHPNVVALFDSGEADGLPYFVMPYIKGESLRKRIQREERLALDEVVRITNAVAAGLAHAHESGVIHRDIKPENILLSEDRVLIADFGIAKATAEAGGEQLSTYGLVLGTPEYMSPEQAMDDKVDHRTDIYALGCVVYEMLAGEPPFTGRTRSAVVAKHLKERVPSLDVARADIPRGIAQAVSKSLKKAAADRFSTATDFVSALERGTDTAPFRPPVMWQKMVRSTRSRTILATVAFVLLVLAVLPVARSLFRGGTPRIQGRPRSVIVLPYHTASTTERERELSVELVGLITMELNNWESIRAVPRVSIAGPMFDRGLAGPTLDVIADGIRLARDAGVEALVAVTADIQGDTALVDAVIYDAGTRQTAGRPLQARGRVDAPMMLVRPIVQGILGLGGVPLDPGDLRRRTGNPDALTQEIGGLRDLERWRLEEAEQHFRQAIALDSTFATALHYLAQTLYWMGSELIRRIGDVGAEIPQLTAAAVRHSAGTTTHDSLHIRAFHAFQEGDYETARSLYDALLVAEPMDVYAWLMLGSVEYRDPWLTERGDGTLLPRSNLNVAQRAFSEAVRLQPSFELGYGHMFDIAQRVQLTVVNRGCPGFELPRDELISLWEPTTPRQQLAFCPAALDTIAWLRRAGFDSLDASVAAMGAERLVARSLALLRRWADYAPAEPKPREELTEVQLRQRRLVGLGAPEVLDSLAAIALRQHLEALSLRPDTTTVQLVRLANLYLAVDDIDAARSAIGQVLMRGDSAELPRAAANVLVAIGQPARALPIVGARPPRWYLPDPAGDTVISYGGAERHIYRLRATGGAGVGGTVLRSELDEVLRLWSHPRYNPSQRDLLRRKGTEDFAIGLAADQEILESWAEGLEISAPILQALIYSGRDARRARTYLDSALLVDQLGLGDASESFLQGMVAQRTGDHRLAIMRFARLDSLPLSVVSFDHGWGLRCQSYLLRAESYEALGETAAARQYYRRMADQWADADSLALPLVERARRGSARLGG